MSRAILGIDIGSIAVSIVKISPRGDLLKYSYAFHEGHIKETLLSKLEEYPPEDIAGIALTGEPGQFVQTGILYDSRVSYIKAVKKLHGKPGSLLLIGGEKFGLINFDDEGKYLNYRSNSSCAAGTGSFLDQQSRRLNLSGIEEFSDTAKKNQGNFPKIASRCSVFAKTDLIHVQQEGYQLEEICDGLCAGLARNVIDTVMNSQMLKEPLVVAGGVSLNEAVVQHIRQVTGTGAVTDGVGHVYGAYGAALQLLEEEKEDHNFEITSWNDIMQQESGNRSCHYPPLELIHSVYPDFTSEFNYEFISRVRVFLPVEIDIYQVLSEGSQLSVYLGIDIGSTSSKAVLLSSEGEVLAGLYTRTSGRPVEAVQTLLEAVKDIEERYKVYFTICGTGTTGSGRKFIGEIIGADEALDEITAHARAAYELNQEVDTIIEIGGQDAKFTTMKNGMVTFSIMNNVCAAGTGSFIEEQAKKLDCPIEEFAARAMNTAAPLSSDRCTVFMERDLNQYMNEGYHVNEVLASVLHSVRDNYLTKVAIEKNIGERIFFQGATAKNSALVAAFEQRLKKPIMVSPFCHLTGALGVALNLMDSGITETSFRGAGIYQDAIPLRTEVCELCTNHCKIRIAAVGNETVAFGFLCGRDYNNEKYVKTEGSGFNLIRERKRIYKKEEEKVSAESNLPCIGIPAGLHLYDELYLWKRFFQKIGLPVITSEGQGDILQKGKQAAGAEFCAPVSELHGHVMYLLENSNFVFLPVFIEEKHKGASLPQERRNYCYYTQFSPAIVEGILKDNDRSRILKPVIKSLAGKKRILQELHRMVSSLPGVNKSFRQVKEAFFEAQGEFERCSEIFSSLYKKNKNEDDINVVFLGRPYNVLPPTMNKGIPDIFDRLGVRAFYQDMIADEEHGVTGIPELLDAVHWKYAAHVLKAAENVAGTPGLYPVFITSFKCTPDSYAVEYFKKIMDAGNKPYLILQLDEHDSSVGYETRIEAGIRSFKNHFDKVRHEEKEKANYLEVNPVVSKDVSSLRRKTLLLPRWDGYVGTLMVSVLDHEGIDARMVDESKESIQRSLSQNTGQCIPLHIMVQNTVDYIRKHELDPKNVVMWNIASRISCNLGIFPYYMKSLFEGMEEGFDKIEVYAGGLAFFDFSLKTSLNMFFAYMFGGILRKMGCRIRPYEINKGETDAVLERSLKIFEASFRDGTSRETAVEEVVSLLESIPVTGETGKPKVAIFGDLYARDNEILNQDLIKTIESNGGEAVTTPYSDLMKIVAEPYIKKWQLEGNYSEAWKGKVLRPGAALIEKKYMKYFNRILQERPHSLPGSPEEILDQYGLKIEQSGESIENALKIISLIHTYSDISLFVQTNPAFCCPSLVTEAMAGRIEEITGVPIVTIEYDGTGAPKNNDIIPYLRLRGEEVKEKAAPGEEKLSSRCEDLRSAR